MPGPEAAIGQNRQQHHRHGQEFERGHEFGVLKARKPSVKNRFDAEEKRRQHRAGGRGLHGAAHGQRAEREGDEGGHRGRAAVVVARGRRAKAEQDHDTGMGQEHGRQQRLAHVLGERAGEPAQKAG